MKTGDLITAHGETALILEVPNSNSAKILMQNGWQKWISIGSNDQPLAEGSFIYKVDTGGEVN